MMDDSPTSDASEKLFEGEVSEQLAGSRVDRVLTQLVPGLSRAQAQRLIREGLCSVDGSAPKPSDKLASGALVTVHFREPQTNIEPDDIPLLVLLEDDWLIAVNKPPGMAVHPARGTPSGTLLNALAGHLGPDCRPSLIHRLDRDTSGAIIAAKTVAAHRDLKEQMEDGRVKRTYWALVRGVPPRSSGTIDAPIGTDRGDKTRMAVLASGKTAITHYQVLRSFGSPDGPASLVEVRLETGRTHQIRVHFEWLGCPLLGDRVYRGESGELSQIELALPGQALHSRQLEFTHPQTGDTVTVTAQLPEALGRLIGEPTES